MVSGPVEHAFTLWCFLKLLIYAIDDARNGGTILKVLYQGSHPHCYVFLHSFNLLFDDYFLNTLGIPCELSLLIIKLKQLRHTMALRESILDREAIGLHHGSVVVLMGMA